MTNLALLMMGCLDWLAPPEPEPDPAYVPHQWGPDVYQALKFCYLAITPADAWEGQ